MFTQILLLVSLLTLILSVSQNEFMVVSTTKSPELRTSESRLNTIDEKINRIHKNLQNLESKIHQSTHDEKINTIQHRVDALELKNKENTIDGKINEINRRLEALESKVYEQKSSNEQIFQMLKAMSSSLATNHNSNAVLPRNCREVQQGGHNISKVYLIKPDFSPKAIAVLCDMKRRGGGWTYFLNRFDGSQEFNLKWNQYKVGFGSVLGEFWLGLDNIHYLTGYEVNELLIELVDWDDKEVYAHFDTFSVGGENENYSLKILGDYEGTAGDSLRYSVKMKFSTSDNDQDELSEHCANVYGGAGWWFKHCMKSLLTGKYYTENVTKVKEATGMYWGRFHGYNYSLKKARMMVRPLNIDSDYLPHEKSK